jgi:hypothetical protein
MSREPRFSSRPVLRQGLARLCQSVNYGEIDHLTVRDREPVLSDPECVVLVGVKLDSEQRPRLEADQPDFVLSTEVVRLMALLDKIQNGRISKLEIHAGIPRRVVWENRATDIGHDFEKAIVVSRIATRQKLKKVVTMATTAS